MMLKKLEKIHSINGVGFFFYFNCIIRVYKVLEKYTGIIRRYMFVLK